MLIADMMDRSGRVFMKSEFAPISDGWPCRLFTEKPVGRRLQAEFQPVRDILVYVGTTNGFLPPRLFDQLIAKMRDVWSATQGKTTPRD